MTVEYSNPWTESVTEKMRSLWTDGKTASEIALALNKEFSTKFSRNAVISKGRKLGVQRRRTSLGGWEPKKPTPLPASKNSQIQADSLRTDLKSLLDLKANECHWPIRNPEDEGFGFCGYEKQTGSPYCKAHHKRAYVAAKVYDPRKDQKR